MGGEGRMGGGRGGWEGGEGRMGGWEEGGEDGRRVGRGLLGAGMMFDTNVH